MLERGLPVRADAVTDPRLGTRAPAFGEASSGRAIDQPITKDPKPVVRRRRRRGAAQAALRKFEGRSSKRGNSRELDDWNWQLATGN